MKTFFEDNFDCHVSRIDFVAFQNNTGVGRRAFVHFLYFHDNDFTNALIKNKVLVICCNGFEMTVLINKNPIPETTLNPAQLAANNEFLSEEVKRQAEEITYLKEVQNDLYFRMEGMRQQIEHLQIHVQKPYMYIPPILYPSFSEIQPEVCEIQPELCERQPENIPEWEEEETDSYYDDYDLDSV